MKEWQRKMKFVETQFKILDLVVRSRGIPEEELESLGFDELLKKNSELNKEDFEFNEHNTGDVELVRLLENNFKEKNKIFESKKQFMVYIGDLKSQHQKQLQDLFDDMNKVEDQYTVMQQVIKNFRQAISLNKSELEALQKKEEASKKEKEELEALSAKICEQLREKKESQEKIAELIEGLLKSNESNLQKTSLL